MCFQVGAPCGPDPPAGDDNARMTAPTDARPLSEAELEALQALLDGLPPTLDPLDVVSIDGYLCGVLLQPTRVPPIDWQRWVTDLEGRPLPAGYDAGPLLRLVQRRSLALPELLVGDPVPGIERWRDEMVPGSLIAERGGRVLGYSYFQLIGATGHIRNVVVAPEARDQQRRGAEADAVAAACAALEGAYLQRYPPYSQARVGGASLIAFERQCQQGRRPGGKGGWDIYQTRWENGVWSDPAPVQ